MRGRATLLVILLAASTVGSLGAPAAPVTPLLPPDFSDADLVRALAALDGIHPAGVTLVVPPDVTLPGMLWHIAARSNSPITPEEIGQFAALDAHVQAPALVMLLAIDQAWNLYDDAYRALSAADRAALRALAPDDPARASFSDDIDPEPLVRAAILLLDTIDMTVNPLVQDALDAGVWPEIGIAAGPIRIGGTHDDYEAVDRILQIDPRGNDIYRNNAGGTTVATDLDPLTPDYPIAISLDYDGDDDYDNRVIGALGSATDGIGILQDYGGDDTYRCALYCMGTSLDGIGYMRDQNGSDRYQAGATCLGAGGLMGIFREDGGNDNYDVASQCGGYGFGTGAGDGTGLLWDRGGIDQYSSRFLDPFNFGFTLTGSRGWIVDEGQESDQYSPATSTHAQRHGCNDCIWTAGYAGDINGPHGHGNDNAGGLAFMLTKQDAVVG